MLRKRVRNEFLPLLRNLKRAFGITWRIDRGNTVKYLAAMLGQVITSILATYFAGRVLTELFNVLGNNGTTGQLYRYFMLSVVMLAAEQIAWRLMGYYQNCTYLIWHTQLAPEFNGKLARLDIGRFDDSEFSKLINKVSQDYAWKPANFMYHGYNTFHGLLRLLGTVIALLTFSPWVVLILFFVLIPSIVVEGRHSKVKWDIWHVKGDSSRRYHKVTWMMQAKSDVMDMRLFGLVDYLIDFCRRMLDDFNTEQQKALKRFIRPAVLVRLAEGTVIGLINWWLIKRVIDRDIEVGQYSFYSGMVNQFNNSLSIILGSLGQVYEYNLYMTDYFTFMDTDSELSKAADPVVLAQDQIPEIVFDNVTFRYPGVIKPVFKNLSLTISPGQSVALVGENGAGKSTLIKLLLRFYDVTDGAIYINGTNIKDIDLEGWYRQLGVLLQDFSRYPFTIEENVYMGRIEAKRDKLKFEQAIKHGGVADFAPNYPRGLDTILDSSFDEGVEPSGGQWQRVALSRAFYRDPNVLILDEPTAAIDANAEYEIFKNLNASTSGKTTIIVSHRFSTVRTASDIYVLEHGKIREHGSHDQLMKAGGMYAEMFSKQAEGYK